MGKQWATCGIGIRPPEHLIGDPRIKKLCPKLVPGQVVELPSDHNLLNNSELVETVSKLQHDEFMRPWVFDSVEAAARANPSLSGLSAEAIAQGLALTMGATRTQAKAQVSREKVVSVEVNKPSSRLDYEPVEEDGEGDYYADDEGDNDEGGDDDAPGDNENEKRSGNRVTREVKDNARFMPTPIKVREPEVTPPEETKRARQPRGRAARHV
ncbi:MAG: hypothetical protein WC790_00385 [Candidatus Paceibacterota bacterium]|jgi:hypothetical protein